MFTREYSDTPAKEKIEVLLYQPGLQDSGDLEPATKTITATAEASGLANATYTACLTLPKPSDDRLVVKRICARLQVTIDTIASGDTDLYCRVYVDAQDAAHRLFDLDWTSTGAKLLASDTHSGALAAIFDLLKDGNSHTFYFFFWKAGTGAGITISLVQLWEGVGSCTISEPYPALDILHQGFISICGYISRVGTGTPMFNLLSVNSDWFELYYTSGLDQHIRIPLVLIYNNSLSAKGTVANDLNYLPRVEVIVESTT
jgi:hypothetical protein